MARSFAAPLAPRGATRPLRGLPLRGLGGLAGSARDALRFVWQRRRARIALIVVVAAMPVLGGVWLWVRQSPFVAIHAVRIAGVHGPEAGAIDAALERAAHRMSTLDVHSSALAAAVASFPQVSEVRAVPRFPHGLRIEVVEQLPVAALVVGGERTAVAADGVVLGPSLLSKSLPTVAGYFEPLARQRVRGPNVLAALSVLGAAPAPLARVVTRVFTGGDGLTLQMRSGLEVYFGDATRPHAKWLALVAVLASSSSQGASYVDVRLPSRPAAGFPAGVSAPDASTPEVAAAEEHDASEATVSSIAESLASSAGGSAASTASTPATTAPATTEPQAQADSTPSESSSAPGGEASSTPSSEASQSQATGGG
jgi:cell division septal protein FtsQ